MDNRLLPVLLLLPLIAMAFWFWMAWDMTNNEDLQGDERLYWILAFLFLNFFAALLYYFTEYRKRAR